MDSPQQSQQAFRSLDDLPDELLEMIADYVGNDYITLAGLARTCWKAYRVFNHVLYTKDIKSNNTALAWGALTGHIKGMERAIGYGAQVDQCSYFSFLPGQRMTIFERELNSYSYGLVQTDPSRFLRHPEFSGPHGVVWGTALHFAAVSNQVAAAEWLLDAGAWLREQSSGLCSMLGIGENCCHSLESRPAGFYPMHTALCYGHKDMIELFLRRNGHLEIIADTFEERAGQAETVLSQLDEVPEEISDQGIWDPVPEADWGEWIGDLFEAEVDEFPGIVDWESEPDDPGPPQVTGLHIAASLGRADLIEFVAKNSDIPVNKTDCDGRNPLHYAAHVMLTHPRAAIRKLVQMGARLDAQNDLDYDLIVRCVAEGRCAVAVDLLQQRAYENFNTERLGNLLHAALTPAALHGSRLSSFQEASVANLASTTYSRLSLQLDRRYWGSQGIGDSTSEKDMDFPSRQQLVRILVKKYGVDVNAILPSIPQTPVTLLASCNGNSSDMLRCLIAIGADITKPNGNGETAIHCAMKLYASDWSLSNLADSYGDDPVREFERYGADKSPDDMLCSLLAAWPADKFKAANKKGINVLTCIFSCIFWKKVRYIDLAISLNDLPYPADLVLERMPPAVGINEQVMRLKFVEDLFDGPQSRYSAADHFNWLLHWSSEKEEIRKTVITVLTGLRQKFKLGAKESSVMGEIHTFANFSGKKSGELPIQRW